jgi:hypothetical protein
MNPTFIMRRKHSKDQAINDDETKTIQTDGEFPPPQMGLKANTY